MSARLSAGSLRDHVALRDHARRMAAMTEPEIEAECVDHERSQP